MRAKNLTLKQWQYAKMALYPKYPDEEVYLMLYGDKPLPKWLAEEISKGRANVLLQSNTGEYGIRI